MASANGQRRRRRRKGRGSREGRVKGEKRKVSEGLCSKVGNSCCCEIQWQGASTKDGFCSLAFPPGGKKEPLVEGLEEKIKVQVVRLTEGSPH